MDIMNWKQSDEKCPICSASVWVSQDYMDYTLMEDLAECRNCKMYLYEYITGNYRVYIGGQEFTWSYQTPENEVRRIQVNIDGEIDLLRKKMIMTLQDWITALLAIIFVTITGVATWMILFGNPLYW